MIDEPDGTIRIDLYRGGPTPSAGKGLLGFQVVEVIQGDDLTAEELCELYRRLWRRQHWLTYGCPPPADDLSTSPTERPGPG